VKTFTTEEVGKILGVSSAAVIHWTIAGYLKVFKRGKRGGGNSHRFTAGTIKDMIRKELAVAQERARTRLAALEKALEEEHALP
jgi:hypothetical protein